MRDSHHKILKDACARQVGLVVRCYSIKSVPVSLAETCSAAFSTDLKASSAPGKLHLSGCTMRTSRLTAALML